MRAKSCEALQILLVDLVLGHVGEPEKSRLQTHLNVCRDCRETFAEFSRLLNAPAEPPPAPPPHLKRRILAAASAERNGEVRTLPSKRQKIARMLQKIPPGCGRSWRRRRFRALVTSFAACLFFLFTGTFLLWKDKPAVPRSPDPWQLVRHPQTVSYSVREAAIPVEGQVWVNRQSREMLIVLEGLAPVSNRDYQAWLVSATKRENAGIVKIVSRRGLLYYRGNNGKDYGEEEAEAVWITLEPSGGQREPTGPKILQVDFAR
ncbi:hypothetical protein BSNK01_02150 [Bacillaceae bacterium]